ncbi:InlB B-repeat-containing protein [Treponema zioleckii]|uniref:InlB B-repeat-containing protein n=1 Tax=Treponema zioleckii TaxID=331680 RepID=UPI00168BB4E0|nr:InlB B-repeat-containing protein [Treponema zioleckii]
MQKSLIKKLLLSLASVALLFAFNACSSDSDSSEPAYYTVTFNSNGGSEVASQTVESGTLATRPEAPSRTGYTFSAWLCGEADFDFATKITADTTLTAKWTANTYTVTLDNNGEKTEITATYGKKLPDLEDVPTLANSNFGGFYTEKYAKGTKFIDS